MREEYREETPSFLRQFARRRTAAATVEWCELCSAPLDAAHPHLLEPKTRQIVCACDGCALLFCGQEHAHYLRIPRRIERLTRFCLAETQWEALLIPINLAFFYHDSAAGRMRAMYPSPAGATESLLDLSAWEEIAAQNAALRRMEPDVEALLVNRIGADRNPAGAEYFLVPIDVCYRLVGTIRMHWHGLSGGAKVWEEINHFFDELRALSVSVEEPSHA
jgi:hypothetical protein